MRTSIRFLLGSELVEIDDCLPTDTVLDFLREQRRRPGTKEGCSEGDCGACTVVLGELRDGSLRYRAFNACILFLPALDGKQLLTVEDLAENGELHPVQAAMVDQHGSQCGFCTPGFILSMFALYHDRPGQGTKRHDIELGLAGNLCRCTGYAPILRAAEATLQAGRSDRFAVMAEQTKQRLRDIQPVQSLAVGRGDSRYLAPRTTSELADILASNPDAKLVAGATDVGLWVTKQLRELPVLVSTREVPELAGMTETAEHIRIGAAVTYTDVLPVFRTHYPPFADLIERLGAQQVRNAGTVGGNIANGSPIGDMPPGLVALGATITLAGARGQRIIALEDYFLAYGKQDLQPGEYLECVTLPKPVAGQEFGTYKVSKRFEQDISAVCAGFSLQLEDGKVNSARLCYGGMAATPRRAARAEHALLGQAWNEHSVRRAMKEIETDFTPISDMRATSGYRTAVAANLLWRFYLDTSAPGYPTRLSRRWAEQQHA